MAAPLRRRSMPASRRRSTGWRGWLDANPTPSRANQLAVSRRTGTVAEPQSLEPSKAAGTTALDLPRLVELRPSWLAEGLSAAARSLKRGHHADFAQPPTRSQEKLGAIDHPREQKLLRCWTGNWPQSEPPAPTSLRSRRLPRGEWRTEKVRGASRVSRGLSAMPCCSTVAVAAAARKEKRRLFSPRGSSAGTTTLGRPEPPLKRCRTSVNQRRGRWRPSRDQRSFLPESLWRGLAR